jgi:hypothetical protein
VGREDEVMARDALMVMESVAVAVLEAESVTFTVKVEVPDDVGVPLIIPAVERVRLAGSEPLLTVHV